MPYLPLAKIFHMDASASRFTDNELLARQRLEADSTLRTGIVTECGELFCAVPSELSVLTEKVLRLERRVSACLTRLPPIARAALMYNLIIDEVVSTNDLEGVQSTRAQIRAALDSLETDSDSASDKRFRELARLYLELSDKHLELPRTPGDIRAIYDRVMRGEDTAGLADEGGMFRKHGVDIVGAGGRVLHRGVDGEGRIAAHLDSMLRLLESDEIPQIYSSIMAHYVFEYIHPFYDGNGRTGRLLLALYLSRPLSLLSTLSLSRAIAENRGDYYRSFRTAEDPLNHGELTFFVMNILETVLIAQSTLVEDLDKKEVQLQALESAIEGIADTRELTQSSREILGMLAQFRLFASFSEISLREVAAHLGVGEQMARKHIKALEGRGLAYRSGTRPLRFSLTNAALKELGL